MSDCKFTQNSDGSTTITVDWPDHNIDNLSYEESMVKLLKLELSCFDNNEAKLQRLLEQAVAFLERIDRSGNGPDEGETETVSTKSLNILKQVM